MDLCWKAITFMASTTFMVKFYYIYGLWYIYGWYKVHWFYGQTVFLCVASGYHVTIILVDGVHQV